jgi:hypothetical protein
MADIAHSADSADTRLHDDLLAEYARMADLVAGFDQRLPSSKTGESR